LREEPLDESAEETEKEPAMEVKELGHIVLYVRNVQRSVAFYRDVLGFRMAVGPDSLGFPAAMFSSPSDRTHHELLLIEVGEDAPGPPPGRRYGLYHFGLKIGDRDEELRQALERLQEAGVRIVGTADHTVTHSLYILDPDGNEIELYVDVPGVDWRSDPALVASPIRPLRL
jgi:catechol 2,3-dioxygenase